MLRRVPRKSGSGILLFADNRNILHVGDNRVVREVALNQMGDNLVGGDRADQGLDPDVRMLRPSARPLSRIPWVPSPSTSVLV